MQEKHMVIKNMLLYRILLCFNQDGEKNTVTAISKKLNVEKYQVSRVISSMEEEGIVEKDSKGVPSLTKYGEEYLAKYQHRVEILISFLLRAKVDSTYARDLALHIAANANDEIISAIEKHEYRSKSRAMLSEKLRFSGNHFAQKLQTGSYAMPCSMLIRLDNGLMTYLSQQKPHVMKLNIDNKGGTLQFFPDNNRIKNIKFFNNGEYIQAEKLADMYYMPVECLGFSQMGNNDYCEISFIGIVNVKIKIMEAGIEKEREGIIEIFF